MRFVRPKCRQLLPHFASGARILEFFGSGTGEQARFLADRGFDVVAIIFPAAITREIVCFRCRTMTAGKIPLKDGSIDIVFSSNVLEHVEDLDGIFAEFRRILKPDGFALHVLPTPAWRLWTFATGVAASLSAAATCRQT